VAATHNSAARRLSPARPGWQRLSLLTLILLIGWALLVPPHHQPQWWQLLPAAAVAIAFVGSWHSQHLSTAVRRWAPMRWRNHRRRAHPGAGTTAPRRRSTLQAALPDRRPAQVLEAQVVIQLRPHPHTLTTPADHADQLPWEFITAWLDRYGVRADALTVCSVTKTPPASGLRSDFPALLSGRTPQHRDTWLIYTLRADSNVAALTARQTTIGRMSVQSGDSDSEGDGQVPAEGPRRASLADTTARRLVAELRERGWLATLCDQPEELPAFVGPAAKVRREYWTATEYSDGFRAVYAIEPQALGAVLDALPTTATKSTWVVVTIRSRGRQPATLEACAATLTATRPLRRPLPGMYGFHGLHRQVASVLTATGFDSSVDAHGTPPTMELASVDLAALPWCTTAFGVLVGFNRARQPVYLGLASPEPVRITVTGSPDFHMRVVARLALSGLPVAMYTSGVRRWERLANHAAAQQILLAPSVPMPDSIIVSDGSVDPPAGRISVALRRPQPTAAPATTIVITQDRRRPDLYYITTAHGSQWLSARL
jgi:hypothetical protein